MSLALLTHPTGAGCSLPARKAIDHNVTCIVEVCGCTCVNRRTLSATNLIVYAPIMIAEVTSYTDQAASALRKAPPRRKSSRTKQSLKLATAQVLENLGYHEMRVIDITRQAGVSEATFYTYFKDRHEITLLVLTDVLENSPLKRNISVIEGRSPFEAILQMNRAWFGAYKANAGLTRCLLQFGDSDTEFAPVLQNHHARVRDLIVEKVVCIDPTDSVESNVARLLVFALSAMMDEVAREIFVFPHPQAVNLLDELDLDIAELVQALSVIWHRTLFPGKQLNAPIQGNCRALKLLNRLTPDLPTKG